MARSVTFNGITRFTPGGITRINAAGLAQVTLSPNSIVGIVGEADGGAPGSTASLVSLFDPARAAELFKSGPIVDALNLAFQSSNDPDVPGGASQVLVYKTNESTASALSLPADPSADVVNSAATGGSTTTLVDSTLTATTVNDQYNGMWLVVDPAHATLTEARLVTDYVASTGTFTLGGEVLTTTPVAQDYVVLAAELVDVVSGVPTTTTIPLQDQTAGTGMTVDEHAGRWVMVHDDTVTPATVLRQIVSNTASVLTVSPAMAAAPVALTAYVEILGNAVDLTSKDWGEHTNSITVDVATGTAADTKVVTVVFEGEEEVSPDLGGSVQMHVFYNNSPQTSADVVLGDGTEVVPNTTTSVELVTGGLTPSPAVGDSVGQQVLINGEYTVITENTATVITFSPALSAVPGDGLAVSFRGTLTMNVGGAAGNATGLTTDGTLDDLAITFTTGQTLRQLLDTINANSSYVAVAGQAVNADTTLVADFDFGPATTANIGAEIDLGPTEGTTRNVMAIVDYLNDFSVYVKAVRSADTGSTVSGCCPPADILEPVYLTGGARGATSNAEFQAGLDELLKVRCNSVVPLIDQDLANEGKLGTATVASVAAQLADHVATARGTGQDKAGERGGFQGFRGTKTEVIAQANSLNDMDVALVAQNPTTLNALGSLQEFGPRMLAVMAASMRSGVTEVAEPLTHKLIRVSGLTQDASWDPGDLTDANEAIINGILFAEVVDGVGTRWVRDLTTWIADDNLAYSEGSVRDAVRFVAYGLRTTLVERFTGKKATPATIANVKDAAATFLELTRQDSIIVDSTDPTTGSTIKAYHNLKVTSSGDTVRINVGIFPVPGINFQLTDIFLQLPTQSS
jgi:hypothetical protein